MVICLKVLFSQFKKNYAYTNIVYVQIMYLKKTVL